MTKKYTVPSWETLKASVAIHSANADGASAIGKSLMPNSEGGRAFKELPI